MQFLEGGGGGHLPQMPHPGSATGATNADGNSATSNEAELLSKLNYS